ncbi:efflux RND transporter periplasmic adaptor subunit [Thaumasiovibrio subtropicus]|uniref:efflux RND transporter periplasmic adaptor subunit n=1 Tax=Thaumasiovibrio subtropicus TaxID=1891207 RepID=UPI000B353DC0|nr:hypothetical protein [Thaumasiovibrio subtropicus]
MRFLLLASIALLLSGCNWDRFAFLSPEVASTEISSVAVYPQYRLSGELTSPHSEIQAPIAGVLSARYVNSGQFVESGERLFSVEDAEGHSRDIKATTSGRIGDIRFEMGEVIPTRGSVIAELSHAEPMTLHIHVSREALGYSYLKTLLPDNIELSLQASPELVYHYTAQSSDVIRGKEYSRTVGFHTTIPNPEGQLISGSTVDVVATAQRKVDMLAVPEAAVYHTPKYSYLKLVDHRYRVVERKVNAGRQYQGLRLIRGQVSEGDILVIDDRVREGDRVRLTRH